MWRLFFAYMTYSRTGGVSDAKAKVESVYATEVEGVMPMPAEEEETSFEEKLMEEKKLTKKLNARIKKLEGDTKKMQKALELGVKCAKQLLGKRFFFLFCVCVCVCARVCVCVCVSVS